MKIFSERRLSCFHAALCVMVIAFTVSAASCSNKEETLLPDDYSEWKRTTSEELDYPIPGHEEHYRRIFINETGTEPAVTEQNGRRIYDYPDGTIIIKEIYEGLDYQEGDQPARLTAMIKDRDNSQSRGGWLWVVKDLESEKEQIFDGELCVTCHANANEAHFYGDNNPDEEFRDYVFFPWQGDKQQ
ncbi:MAG: cytochrome P460 family protein [Spirochaetales bacterium]|nr:cytochrome P460 family protein [Spirochaetales bacterium]MCF7937931.1 cytochrome P460 family protein [Spirochaetales bacterium]